MKNINTNANSLKNHHSFFIKNIFNLRILNKFLLFLIILAGLAYLALINDLAIKGYVLGDVKAERNKLADNNKKLELKVMSLSSYSLINEKIKNLKMVAVGNIDYLNADQAAVAKK